MGTLSRSQQIGTKTKGRAGLEPAAGQLHLMLAQVGRSKNRTIAAMGAAQQGELSTAAEKLALSLPNLLVPFCMPAGVWRKKIQVVTSHGPNKASNRCP